MKQKFTLRDKISALLMDTSEEKHLKVDISLDTPEDQGLSSLDKLRVLEIWQHPTEGIIMVKIDGCPEPQELEEYEDCLLQIYCYLKALCRYTFI